MLWAGFFAFAALDTVGGFAIMYCVDVVVVVICIPVVKYLLGIHAGEKIRDGNLFRASCGTVATGSTWDCVLLVENICYFVDCFHFFLIQRLEVFHKADVVFHLLHIAHTGKNHENAIKSSSKTKCIACRAAAVKIIQNLLGIFWKVYKVTAFNRFHDQHRFIMLTTDFVALAALYSWILIVQIVELDLDNLDLWILGKNLIQSFCLVVEGNSEMMDLTLFFQLESSFISVTFFKVFKNLFIL